MNRFFKCFVLILTFVFLSPALFACNEETFASTPWEGTEKTASELVDEIEFCKSEMIENVGLKVKYNTTTTFNLYGDDGKKITKKIVDNTTTILDNNNNVTNILTNRTEGDKKIFSEETMYLKEDLSFNYYTKSEQINPETNASVKKYFTDTFPEDLTCLKLLNKTIISANPDEISSIKTKSFEDITYYQFAYESGLMTQGLSAINKKFKVNQDLYNNPHLFEKRSERDYVVPFTYTYGINANKYLVYFAINYAIEFTPNIDNDTSRPKYINVVSETKLSEYGDAIEVNSKLEDKDVYISSTFVDIANSVENYIQYWEFDADTQEHTLTTVHKKGNDFCFKEESGSGAILANVEPILDDGTTPNLNNNPAAYFYAKYNEKTQKYVIFEMTFLDGKTIYSEVMKKPAFLNINYNRSFYNNSGDNYQFGSAENYITVKMENHKVASVINASSNLRIMDYGNGPFKNDTKLNEPGPDKIIEEDVVEK